MIKFFVYWIVLTPVIQGSNQEPSEVWIDLDKVILVNTKSSKDFIILALPIGANLVVKSKSDLKKVNKYLSTRENK